MSFPSHVRPRAAVRRGRCAAFAPLLLVLAATAHGQSAVPGAPRSVVEGGGTIAAPSTTVRTPRPIVFMVAPEAVVGFRADEEGFTTFEAVGPGGVRLTIKSVSAVSIGGRRAADLFTLVEPAPAASGSAGAVIGTPVLTPKLPVQAPALIGGAATPLSETVRKRLRYAGVPGFVPTAPVAVEVVVEAGGGGAASVTKTATVLLGVDSGPPQIAFAGASPASLPVFPRFLSPPENTTGWNLVKPVMEVQIDAKNFTIPENFAPPQLRAAYHVIAEYADGAKFSVGYSGAGRPANVSAGATRTIAKVPNVGRGGFRIILLTPFGTVRDARVFTFPDNTFTSHPRAFCPVQFIGVDQQASAPTEESFWPPVSFQPKLLTAQRTCGDIYGEWEDVDIETTTMAPAGIASSKITRRPAKGSLAHDGNMPGFACSAAGLGSVTIKWRARLKIYVGECPDKRVP